MGAEKPRRQNSLQTSWRQRNSKSYTFGNPQTVAGDEIIREKASREDSLTPEEELDLFVKDRRENVTHNLARHSCGKSIVILDRYYFSTIAYQGAKGIDPEAIREMHESFAHLRILFSSWMSRPI